MFFLKPFVNQSPDCSVLTEEFYKLFQFYCTMNHLKGISLCLLAISFLAQACAQKQETVALSDFPQLITDPGMYNALSSQEKSVILDKGTEWAFTGAYHNYKKAGTYICKQCNQPLFRSEDKFDSGTGWPSFDDYIGEGVTELADADGRRTEIVCSNCDGHLGHVFRGEGFTSKQTRHCVNSISMKFVEAEK